MLFATISLLINVVLTCSILVCVCAGLAVIFKNRDKNLRHEVDYLRMLCSKHGIYPMHAATLAELDMDQVEHFFKQQENLLENEEYQRRLVDENSTIAAGFGEMANGAAPVAITMDGLLPLEEQRQADMARTLSIMPTLDVPLPGWWAYSTVKAVMGDEPWSYWAAPPVDGWADHVEWIMPGQFLAKPVKHPSEYPTAVRLIISCDGRRVCPRCKSIERVHGGCDCGFLAANIPIPKHHEPARYEWRETSLGRHGLVKILGLWLCFMLAGCSYSPDEAAVFGMGDRVLVRRDTHGNRGKREAGVVIGLQSLKRADTLYHWHFNVLLRDNQTLLLSGEDLIMQERMDWEPYDPEGKLPAKPTCKEQSPLGMSWQEAAAYARKLQKLEADRAEAARKFSRSVGGWKEMLEYEQKLLDHK